MTSDVQERKNWYQSQLDYWSRLLTGTDCPKEQERIRQLIRMCEAEIDLS